jgi:hypothetical protein
MGSIPLLVGLVGILYGAPEPAQRVIVVPIEGIVDLGMTPFVERASV